MWLVSRVCEMFSCTPSVAVRELRRQDGLIAQIAEYRAYADAFERFRTSSAEDAQRVVGADPMLDLVWEITADLMKARGAGE